MARSGPQRLGDRLSEALKGIAIAQAKGGECATALATAQSISGPQDRVDALRGIALAESRAGKDPTKTFQLAHAVTRDGLTPLQFERAVCALVDAQVRAGQRASALEAVAQLPIPKQHDALVAIAVAEAERGSWDEALASIRRIVRLGSRSKALRTVLIRAVERRGCPAPILHEAQEIARGCEGETRDSMLLSIASATAEDGSLSDVLPCIRPIVSDALRAEALGDCAYTLARRIRATEPE